jgi:hypothetical protein
MIFDRLIGMRPMTSGLCEQLIQSMVVFDLREKPRAQRFLFLFRQFLRGYVGLIEELAHCVVLSLAIPSGASVLALYDLGVFGKRPRTVASIVLERVSYSRIA